MATTHDREISNMGGHIQGARRLHDRLIDLDLHPNDDPLRRSFDRLWSPCDGCKRLFIEACGPGSMYDNGEPWTSAFVAERSHTSWHCEWCGASGTVQHEKHDDVMTVVRLISDDHQKTRKDSHCAPDMRRIRVTTR